MDKNIECFKKRQDSYSKETTNRLHETFRNEESEREASQIGHMLGSKLFNMQEQLVNEYDTSKNRSHNNSIKTR
jgi:hypothetical protein